MVREELASDAEWTRRDETGRECFAHHQRGAAAHGERGRAREPPSGQT